MDIRARVPEPPSDSNPTLSDSWLKHPTHGATTIKSGETRLCMNPHRAEEAQVETVRVGKTIIKPGNETGSQ